MDIQKKIGRYEVVAVMGQGAMGTVYKAVDPLIERVVAIKTINLELSREERAEFEERFYREAKSAGRLSHPNIVTIYDVGETDEAAYIAMEYLEGEPLRTVLDSGVVLPIRRICRIAARVAAALGYAHENGVVHRDIKPANIMILRNRDVKIMDFGIAQIPTGSRTQAGTVLGSPKYMAPEQLAGRPIDGRADIFSLGAVLYEMLTGTTPFNGDNLSTIMYKVVNEVPPLPSELNARVPRELDLIVARALAKRPEDRYQTAQEMARDLKAAEARMADEAPEAVPAAVRRKAASPVAPEPQTELLLPRRSESQAKTTKTPGGTISGRRRGLALLALPLLGLAAYAVLQTRQPPAATAPLPVEQAAGQALGQTNEPPQSPAEPAAADQPGLPPAPPPKSPAAVAARPAPAAVAAAPAAPVQTAPSAIPVEAAPAPVSKAAPTGLAFAIAPWGEVFIDGRRAGISPPLTQLELDAGKHRIEIHNGEYAPYRIDVDLAAGETLKIKHKFK